MQKGIRRAVEVCSKVADMYPKPWFLYPKPWDKKNKAKANFLSVCLGTLPYVPRKFFLYIQEVFSFISRCRDVAYAVPQSKVKAVKDRNG